MNAVVVNGQLWRVVRVPVGDPRLVDRTGVPRLATTDPVTRTVCLREDVEPPLLDQVALHEAAHVVTVGMLPQLHAMVPYESRVPAEEWAARAMELHGLEAVDVASRMLGRPVCVRGLCGGQPGQD